MRSMILASLAAAVLLVGQVALVVAQSDNDRPTVMFSTDYGLGIINGATNGPDRHAADTDDAYAVSLLLPVADVRAVVTTFGNDKARPSAESARRGLAALGVDDADSLVSVGAEGFLDAAPVTFVPSVGTDDVPFFCANEGVERMRSVLAGSEPGSVTLFAIGPFTDIACLQRVAPDEFGDLKEIIALVGSADGTLVLEGISVVDFNFAMDPSALGEVIAGDHDVPITFLMFEVSQLGSIGNDVLDGWTASDDAAQAYYGAATQPHAAYWDAIFGQTDGQALFDAHTAYYFLEPDAYTCEDGMTATATVGGYPDTSASTSKNTLAVASNGGDTPAPAITTDGAVHTYSGPVRGCSGFASSAEPEAFEQAVIDSIVSVAD